MIKTAEEFVYLRESENPEEYNRAAHESAELETWQTVIRKYPDIKKWVVHNKTVPLEILESLLHDEDADVRSSIASKNKITEDMFHVLVDDKDSSVRNRLIFNKNVPKAILEKLANDDAQFVRENAKLKLLERNKPKKLTLGEYEDFFWNKYSFHYELEEEHSWNIEKYWELEYQLIRLSELLANQEKVTKAIARNLYFLGNSLNNLIGCHKDKHDFYVLSGASDDEIYESLDRFNHLMRILWEAGSYKHGEWKHFFYENPLYADLEH